jgi:hypothetical protein
MRLQLLTPAKSLNPAYFKQSIKREEIDLFKAELQKAFKQIDERQGEEYHKNIISHLLKEVYLKDKYLVNVNNREDLTIRNGENITDTVGVILEFKKPTEKRAMVSTENANVKALQELVLYYLRETVDKDKHEIKHIIATNIYEWFIFDEIWFEQHFYHNTKLRKDFRNWEVSGHSTQHFYDFIASKYISEIDGDVPCTYINLKQFEKIIASSNKGDDQKLINLYKVLSPAHLLKKPFANDGNTLNKEFYNELLYILGLAENKEKKTIGRLSIEKRSDGSIIENTIASLKRLNHFGFIENEDSEAKYFELALELCITWLNRILFLKLIEGQLIKYHNSDLSYSFLNIDKIRDWKELEELFFEVLAIPIGQRSKVISNKYTNVPYLNSSLFEITDLEKKYQGISQLKDRLDIPVYYHSILKDPNGKRILGDKPILQYLFLFLDAFNFSSDSNAVIQEQNKSIINASVLGLIFEKINGYKDGSVFTPSFITMYMCREAIRMSILNKFNETNNWNCASIDELRERIDYTNEQDRKTANEIINSIKICDPAVGSGHFLVSALNELIATKSYLRVLNYRNGNRVKGFNIEVANDELVIKNEETDKLFDYALSKANLPLPEVQPLQEALFHEKQDLIENCLFGVDINTNSVKICQLRLWIELLKNAYYKKESNYAELETLPNIDINIKCGNSLISRFSVDDDISKALKKINYSIKEYRTFVADYKNEKNREAKIRLQNIIRGIKEDFKTYVGRYSKKQREFEKLNEELHN